MARISIAPSPPVLPWIYILDSKCDLSIYVAAIAVQCRSRVLSISLAISIAIADLTNKVII
jgi:hypothetical protein